MVYQCNNTFEHVCCKGGTGDSLESMGRKDFSEVKCIQEFYSVVLSMKVDIKGELEHMARAKRKYLQLDLDRYLY